MIYYDRACLCIVLSGSAHIKAALSQRLVWSAFAIAIPFGVISAIVKIIDERYDLLHVLMPDTLIYGTLSSMVAFMLVFRTSQAYSRFAEGCTLMHVMQANFIDVSALLISLSRASKADCASIFEFRRIAIRLVSILNALCLLDLSKVELRDLSSLANMVIDLQGLDAKTLQALERSPCKPVAACQLLQNLVSDSLDGVLKGVPAPLLTRTYQELGSGMIRFHEAQKFVLEPFPFPFGTVAEIIYIFHTIYTPFQIAVQTQGPFSAFLFTVGFAFVVWSLYGLALELDDPFGTDMNDLDLNAMQNALNKDLLHLLISSSAGTPSLCQDAVNEHTLIETGYDFSENGDAVLRKVANSVQITQNDFVKPRTSVASKSSVMQACTAAPQDKAGSADEIHESSESSQGSAMEDSRNNAASHVKLEIASAFCISPIPADGPTNDTRRLTTSSAWPSPADSRQGADSLDMRAIVGSEVDIELANEPGHCSQLIEFPSGDQWNATMSSEWPSSKHSMRNVACCHMHNRPGPEADIKVAWRRLSPVTHGTPQRSQSGPGC